MRPSCVAMLAALTLLACRSSPSRPESAVAPDAGAPTGTAAASVPARPADAATAPPRAPSGEPECDRYIAAMEAAKACHPQPPGTPEKMDAAIANILAALREVPREKETARAMIIAGCKHGADEFAAALASLGCHAP
jgi:hypothetical protein